MEKKYIFFIVVPVFVAVSMAFIFTSFVGDQCAIVVVSSIRKETLIYGGSNHQIFSGYVVNQGNKEADNVVVYVNWLDMNNGEHEGFCEVGSLGVGESAQFNVDFPSNNLVMVSYYAQWVTFE